MQDFFFFLAPFSLRIMCYSGEKSCLLSQSCYGFNDYKFIAIDMYFDFLLFVTRLGFCGE